MKQKILKLIKILNKFTLDDILSMDDFDTQCVVSILQELEEDGVVKKTQTNEYIYSSQKLINNKNANQNGSIQKQNIKLDFKPTEYKLFTKAGELEVFEKAPKYAKKVLIKYYTILKLVGSLRGYNLEAFLKQLSKEYPEYKISLSTFHRIKYKYLKGGLKELIPKYYLGAKSTISPEMYSAFKKLYLKPSQYSLKDCVKLLEYQFEKDSIPGHLCFRRLINKEFTPEVIDKIRSLENALPDLNLIEKQINKKENKDISYEYFIDGAREYIKILDNLKDKESASRKSSINNHLIPFFKNYRFSEITQNLIINFQNKKVTEGFSIGSIKRFLGTLSAIYYKYSDCDTQIQFTSHNDLIQSIENPILTDCEIKEIIKDRVPELWILCLGISPAELEALDYNDINFENNTVNINKFFYKTVQKHRRTYKIRTLKLHPLLLKTLKPNGKGKIITNLDIKNFEVLQNTHVKLLLEQNVPINIIYKNMGFQCLNDFENRFRYLLPNKLEDDFDILGNYL